MAKYEATRIGKIKNGAIRSATFECEYENYGAEVAKLAKRALKVTNATFRIQKVA